MSTFYATFPKWTDAQTAVQELVSGGVGPDDMSLIACRDDLAPQLDHITDEGFMGGEASVGDASVFVGRKDDPDTADRVELNSWTTTGMSRVSPIDTSDIATDVESVDQMDDSQAEAETEMTPFDGISHSTHENDDLALSVLTGFPSAPPGLDDVRSGDFEQEDQFLGSLEAMKIEGFGYVVGGGGLATAALDFAKHDGACNSDGLVSFLVEDGVPKDEAQAMQDEFKNRSALMAVVITPGEINENAVEEIATRNGGKSLGLFDAPRY